MLEPRSSSLPLPHGPARAPARACRPGLVRMPGARQSLAFGPRLSDALARWLICACALLAAAMGPCANAQPSFDTAIGQPSFDMAHAQPPFGSAHAIVVDELSGEVLAEKDAHRSVPMASLTKLVTAMVVLDAHPDPDMPVTIEPGDLDTIKHTRFGVPAGTTLPWASMLELALMASDNHAAAALARVHPGGLPAFLEAVQRKLDALGLQDTVIDEPTGLSAANRSSAADMVRIAAAAAAYGPITAITSTPSSAFTVNGHARQVRNTNHLVGQAPWNILLSKTGFTNEAGRCVAMRMEVAGRTVLVVLMGASASVQRWTDAQNVQRWLSGQPLLSAADGRRARTGSLRRKPVPTRRVLQAAAARPAAAPALAALRVSDTAE